MSVNRPSYEEAKQALELLLRFIGEDPTRQGLVKTPDRIVRAYEEIFSGYKANLDEIFEARFKEISEFRDLVLLKDISFKSFCEHHWLPFYGTVDIAYIPNGSVLGVSKLARLVDIFSRRLQIQEKMTAQIGEALQDNLAPLGVAVKVKATHSCMSFRGVLKEGSIMSTLHYTGIFADNPKYKREFLTLTH